MSKARWSADQFKTAKLIETDKGFVKASSLVDKNPVKIEPDVNSFGGNTAFSVATEFSHLVKNSPNKKIKNAVKTVVDGITFDSGLEAYMYTLLKGAGITFERQVAYLLQPGFKYNGETIRPIQSFVDFWLPTKNVIIDCKGYANDIAPMKFKMLKRVLFEKGEKTGWELPKIHLPSTKKECDILLNNLLYKP